MKLQLKTTGSVKRVSVLAAFGLLILFGLPYDALAQTQWATSGNNINNTNTGNVGVGTANPQAKLHVNKTLRIDDDSGSANGSDVLLGAPGLYLGTSAGGGYLQFNGSGGIDLWQFNGAWGRTVTFAKTGNVGFGTTSPSSRFTVQEPVSLTSGEHFLTDFRTGLAGTDAQLLLGYRANGAAVTGSLIRAANNKPLFFGTSSANTAMTILDSGNVGIGTTTPVSALDVHAVSAGISTTSTTGTNRAYFVTTNTGGSVALGSESSAGQSIFNTGTLPYAGVFGTTQARPVQFVTSHTARMTIDASGNVGIGTPTPSTKLHVAGDGKFTGSLTVDGNIAAKYQDVAEWVESSQSLPAGTVVVLDHTKSNQVVASTEAYDTRVAGVISTQPGIALGESGDAKVLVATTGRVRIKVDATGAPIQIGDLLVTGDKEGFAMKSVPVNIGGVRLHRPGTLVGKALEPLEKGTGEILVLLSLQ